MPERFETYIVYKRRYINTLPFLSFPFFSFKPTKLTKIKQNAISSRCNTLRLSASCRRRIVPGGLSSQVLESMPRPPSQAEQLTAWTLACYLRHSDTDTACTHENVHSSNHGSYNHRLEKLMRLADILPGGGGWRKNRLSRLSRFFIGGGG